jgi:hypothetical protein
MAKRKKRPTRPEDLPDELRQMLSEVAGHPMCPLPIAIAICTWFEEIEYEECERCDGLVPEDEICLECAGCKECCKCEPEDDE